MKATTYNNVLAISHQGYAISFSTKDDGQTGAAAICYNVLQLDVDSSHDNDDWQTYLPLTYPDSLSLAGFNMLRVPTRDLDQAEAFRVITDQQHIYLVRLIQRQLYINRYILAPEEQTGRSDGSGLKEKPQLRLLPAWEVRYRRSEKPDTPLGPRDTQGFLDMEDQPFIEPAYVLPFGTGLQDDHPLWFDVQFIPTTVPDELAWQISVVTGGKLYSFSIAKPAGGWFRFDAEQFDEATKSLLPNTVVSLTQAPSGNREAPLGLTLSGPPAACVYNKQEPVRTANNEQLKMQNAYRYMLACPTRAEAEDETEQRGLAILDFAVSSSGRLAFQHGINQSLNLDTGQLNGRNFNLIFNGLSYLSLPEDNPVSFEKSFTQQCWVLPGDGGCGRQYILGSTAANEEDYPPVVYITNRHRVGLGFGDGKNFLVAETKENVLEPGSWANLLVVYNTKGYHLYVNGTAVALKNATAFKGKTPLQTPLSRIGTGGEGSKGYVGQLDEVRIWEGDRTAVALDYLYKPLDSQADWEALKAYWPLNDGAGSTARDRSRKEGANARLFGARWVAGAPPIQTGVGDISVNDDRGLTVRAGVIFPGDEEGAFPLFGAIKPGTKPSLLASNDGKVHLYYQGENDEFLGAQYDTSISRAVYGLPWQAGPETAGDSTAGYLLFTGRQAGTLLNKSTIQFKKTANELYQLNMDDGTGNSETWEGLLNRVDYVASVLDEKYESTPQGSALQQGTRFFYDTTGTYYQNFLPVGDPDQHGYLHLVSTRRNHFVIDTVQITVQGDPGFCEVQLTGSVDPDSSNRVEFGGTIRNVPTDTAVFARVLNGQSTEYDYNSIENQGNDNTSCYRLPAGRLDAMILVPDSEVTGTAISVTGDSEVSCTVTIKLTLKGKGAITGTWKNIPRNLEKLAESIKSGKNKKVADYIHFYYPADAAKLPVSNVDTSEPEGLLALLSFLRVFPIHSNGNVRSGELKLTCIQSVSSLGWAGSLRRLIEKPAAGSPLFAVRIDKTMENGYPKLLKTSATGLASADRLKPGIDGGWLAVAPQYALQLKSRSLVSLDDRQLAFNRLDLPGALTLEAWANPDTPTGAGTGNSPRIIHIDTKDAESDEEQTASPGSYMLGMQFSSSLYFKKGGRLMVREEANGRIFRDDNKNSNAAPIDKIFPDNKHYTIQLYLKPVLKTIEKDYPGCVFRIKFCRKDDSNTGHLETLFLDSEGQLCYQIEPVTGKKTAIRFAEKVDPTSWNCITIVRDSDRLRCYLATDCVGSESDVPIPTGENHELLAGGNSVEGGKTLVMEMALNQFAIWSRAFNDEMVKAGYNRFVQGDADDLRLLWRMDRFSDNYRVINSALITGKAYDAMSSDCVWRSPGVFFNAFAAVRGNAVITREARIAAGSWSHLSAVYQPHYGIQLDGKNYGDCGNQADLSLHKMLSIAAWIKPSSLSGRRVIFSKYGNDSEEQSYEVGILNSKLYVRLRCQGGQDESGNDLEETDQYFECESNKHVSSDTYTHTVVTAELAEVTEETTDEKGITNAKSYHVLKLRIYLDGQLHGDLDTRLYGPVSFRETETSVNIGRNQKEDASAAGYYSGIISDLYLWKTSLTAAQVKALFAKREVPADDQVSAWLFKEQTGRIAYDGHSSNNAVFHTGDNAIWCITHDNASLRLLVNGLAVPITEALPGDFDGYLCRQGSIGGMVNGENTVRNGFSGLLEEVRIWSQARTQEQLTDNMYRYITGLKPHLAGYWSFDTGSGTIAADQSAGGNHGSFRQDDEGVSPAWALSTAPVSAEGPMVRLALGGQKTVAQPKLSGAPAAVEYADMQRDIDGNTFSVLKRCYVYPDELNELHNASGYKVGDLKTVYLGQIQTNPSLIGYVEGAPPLPSENLTKPYYLDPTKPSYFAYNNSSSVKLSQQRTSKFSFSGSKYTGSHLDFSFKIGPGISKETDVGVGLVEKMVKKEVIPKVTMGLGWDESGEDGEQLVSELISGNTNTMYNCGDWEPAGEGSLLLKNGERRFLPNNEGCALVKSATADVYTLLVEDTGALVGITAIPNTDIPPDVNIIYFPLNPQYVKNGTLDGKVGLKTDPDYRGADLARGSYFKPAEAYALKRKIERREQELAARHAQFNAKKKGKDRDYKIPEQEKAALYDWEKNQPKKDMYNTYVWTAAGGLYNEHRGYVTQFQESYAGSYSLNWSAGLDYLDTLVVAGIGVWTELSLNGGTHMKYTAMKSKEESSALSLDIHADPDGYLNKYLGNERSGTPFFSAKPEPGKVDSYRFMTFYLSPDSQNFDTFFDTVVDQEWLRLSNDPRAVALREAKYNSNEAWRVLHRVTYVSRIPPEFDLVPPQEGDSTIEPPPNLEANSYVLGLVADHLEKLKLAGEYGPTQIAKAVKAILDNDLKGVIPWWEAFLIEAQVVNSGSYELYQSLYEDIVAYVDAYYKTR